MRILILRGGALGDFIVTLPALELLRRHWPDAHIELVGNARAAELATSTGILDQAYSQNEARWSALYGEEQLPDPLTTWLKEFDLIINFWPDPDGTIQKHLGSSGYRYLQGGSNVQSRPAAAHFCDVLAPLGLHRADYTVQLKMPSRTRTEARQRLGDLKDFVAIHPGSGSSLKNWPTERWVQLVEKLRRPILAISGEAEPDPLPWPPKTSVLRAYNWPLPVLSAALSQARLYLGHDTGISHLAAMSGTRCALIFGPTDPAVWAPPGKHVHAVQRGPMPSAASVDEMISLAKSLLR